MEREDLGRVSELSEQLGYPVPVNILEDRFVRIIDNADQGLFVAEYEGRVVGWVHAHLQLLLEYDPYAEIGGLVVDQDARRAGAGRALISRVQRWASERRLERIRVRSNVDRQEAHQFYPALGFTWFKTQHNYELRLESQGE